MSEPSPIAAAAAAAVAAKYAEETNSARRLPDPVVAAVVESGLARHFVPVQWGGNEGTFRDLHEALTVIGEGCASAAWCAGVWSSAARMGVYLPQAGQAELWAQGPDTLVVGALIPGGLVEPVAGGWLLSGSWPFTSGVDAADWALVCGVPSADESGGPRFFAVPRDDFRIRDTWHNVGMRGTGSNTLELERVFVPEHRSFLRSRMQEGAADGSAARCHAVPVRVVGGLTFAAPALGAARAALDSWIADIAVRTGPAGPAGANPSIQQTLARASGEIDTAALLLERVARAGDEEELTPLLSARCARDYTLAVNYLVDAVERLFRAQGARGQAESSPVQRAWRDIHCAAGHVGLQFDTAAGGYAAAVFQQHHHN